jgi:hypothetical protein
LRVPLCVNRLTDSWWHLPTIPAPNWIHIQINLSKAYVDSLKERQIKTQNHARALFSQRQEFACDSSLHPTLTSKTDPWPMGFGKGI